MSREELPQVLSHLLGDCEVDGLRRLSAGASRQTFAFDAVGRDGTRRPLIATRDTRRGTGSTPRVAEAPLLQAAAKAGVPVPAVVAEGDGVLVVARVEGQTIPRKLLRDDEFALARGLLTGQCGRALAAIHRIPLDAVPDLERQDQLRTWRALLDGLAQPHPAFELAFRWLEANQPAACPDAVVHGDFRNGNLLVGPDGLRAVLDWELAHVGDRMEDLGWVCVKAWRFGLAPPVGGFGQRAELFAAYEEAGGGAVDPEVVRWWEVLGTLKWGVMCIAQAITHLSGATRSVELAAIGRRVCENEWDLLDLLDELHAGGP